MNSRTAQQAGLDSHRLGLQLVSALGDASVPLMLRTLLKTAQVELQAWHEGRSTRGLTIAAHALAEWHRWRGAISYGPAR